MSAALAATVLGLRVHSEAFVVPLVCAAAGLAIAFFERVFAYEADWNRLHGDLRTDLAHVALTGTLAEVVRLGMNAALVVGAAWLSVTLGSSLWPTSLPLAAQVLLALVVAEFGGYWFHRAQHTTALWRLHAVHHSSTRLYFLNAFRSHPLDLILSQAAAVGPLVLAGAPPVVLALYGVATIVHTELHHSNVDTRLGPLNLLLATAEVHRWHHSRDAGEMSANYGTVLTIWDWVFGTRAVPSDRQIHEVGLDAAHDGFPTTYPGQLAVPFDAAFWERVARDQSGT